jgi:hypothetical protein
MMDLGRTRTDRTRQQTVQIAIASEAGSRKPVPDLPIQVDRVGSASNAMRATRFPIEYGPVGEPWGVRRFHVRDLFGKLVNILVHFGTP